MSVIVQRATLLDVDALVKVETSVFRPSDGLLTKRAFRYHLNSNNLLLVVKETIESADIMGYILVFNRKVSARIYSLAIHPDFQRQGLATTLIKHALTESVANQLCKVSLEVRVSNIKAIKLYKALAFQEQKIIPNYYENEDALRMQWCV